MNYNYTNVEKNINVRFKIVFDESLKKKKLSLLMSLK